jgi:hypothetical protein
MPATVSVGGILLGLSGLVFGAESQWDPDYGRSWKASGRMEAYTTYDNPNGKIGILLKGGPVETKGHPFFRPLGANGRACATCHDPSNGMSLSTASLQKRWKLNGMRDPVFAMVDGGNCPTMLPDQEASHSLLLNRGVFRVALPWPARDHGGRLVDPQFKIEVVRDPTGCNTSPEFGLDSPQHLVSVYRRPRVAANLKFITNDTPELKDRGPYGLSAKTGFALPRTPDGQRTYTLNLMADSRVYSLQEQHEGAIESHMTGTGKPPHLSAADMARLTAFTSQIYSAQVEDKVGGNLIEPGGPAGLGPFNIEKALPGFGGENIDTPVFQHFDQWKAKPGTTATTAAEEFRASVARGADLFISKVFLVRDVNGINTVGLGNPLKRSCALCHNTQMSGHDQVPGWMDVGTTNWPWARNNSDLPLFKLTCRPDVKPAPYLGRVVYTTDPGRALITGRCADIGMITIQQLRGLSARAPYFSNGSAKSLREVVDFYDRRFDIGYTEQEKEDLVNFLRVL